MYALKRRLVLPTFDEFSNLEWVVDRVLVLPEGFEILIVDDDSPDGTGRLADQLAQQHPDRIQVLHRRGRRGLGTAYVEGFERSLAEGAEEIYQMDCDLSHQPEDLSRLADALVSADMVLGSRYIPGGSVRNWSLLRRLVSRFGSLYASCLLCLPIRDVTGGFRAFRADALRRVDISQIVSRGYAFQVEMAYRAMIAGLEIVEIPICFFEREAGQSKMSFGVALEAAWRVPLFPHKLRQESR